MDDAFLKKTFSHPRTIELLIAPKRLRDLFRGSAPDTYRLVSPRAPGSVAETPLELPQALLGLAATSAVRQMRVELPALRVLVAACEDEDFDRFMARAVRAMLRSRGIHNEELERAMSMDTVAVAFRRSLEEIRQEGREEGRREGWEQQVKLLRQLTLRKFGPEIAAEVSRLLAADPDPESIARIAECILDCDAAEEFLARVR